MSDADKGLPSFSVCVCVYMAEKLKCADRRGGENGVVWRKIFKRICGQMIDTTINNMRLMEVISMCAYFKIIWDFPTLNRCAHHDMLQFNDVLLSKLYNRISNIAFFMLKKYLFQAGKVREKQGNSK